MPPQIDNQIEPENIPVEQKPETVRNYSFLIILMILLVATGAFGVWYFLNPLPEEVPEETIVLNELAGWETYRNDEYGFEMKLPNGWSTIFGNSKKSLEIILNDGYTSDNVQFSINIYSFDTNPDLSKWFYENEDFNKYLGNMIKTANSVYVEREGENFLKVSDFDVNIASTSINGQFYIVQIVKCLKSDCYILGRPQNSKEYFFKKYNKIFHLEVITMDPEKDFKILDKFFSTFRFISTSTPSAIDTSNWKTYKNTKYGYEFKYPSNGFIDSESENWVRIQNYNPVNERYSFQSGDFFMEFDPSPSDNRCDESVDYDGKLVKNYIRNDALGTYYQYEYAIYYESGGPPFVLCAKKNNKYWSFSVSEKNNEKLGNIANQIFSTFKFNK